MRYVKTSLALHKYTDGYSCFRCCALPSVVLIHCVLFTGHVLHGAVFVVVKSGPGGGSRLMAIVAFQQVFQQRSMV